MKFLTHQVGENKLTHKPSKAVARKEYRALLSNTSRGLSPSTRYTALKAIESFAALHGLPLPKDFADDLSRAARLYLQAFLSQEHGVDLSFCTLTVEHVHNPDAAECAGATPSYGVFYGVAAQPKKPKRQVRVIRASGPTLKPSGLFADMEEMPNAQNAGTMGAST